MSFALLLTRTATITRRVESGSAGDYNEPAVTESTSTADVYYEQTSASESGVVSQQTLRAFFDASVVLHARDLVTIDAITYEVVGEPARPYRPSSSGLHHIEAILERAS